MSVVKIRIKRDRDGEYRVSYIEDGRDIEEVAYYTNDQDDAAGTAVAMIAAAETKGHEVSLANKSTEMILDDFGYTHPTGFKSNNKYPNR